MDHERNISTAQPSVTEQPLRRAWYAPSIVEIANTVAELRVLIRRFPGKRIGIMVADKKHRGRDWEWEALFIGKGSALNALKRKADTDRMPGEYDIIHDLLYIGS